MRRKVRFGDASAGDAQGTRATIIDACSSGTRERSACAEVSAEVNIN